MMWGTCDNTGGINCDTGDNTGGINCDPGDNTGGINCDTGGTDKELYGGQGAALWQQELSSCSGAYYIAQAHDNAHMAHRLVTRFGSLERDPNLGGDDEFVGATDNSCATKHSTQSVTHSSTSGSQSGASTCTPTGSATVNTHRKSNSSSVDVHTLPGAVNDLMQTSENGIPNFADISQNERMKAFATTAMEQRLSELSANSTATATNSTTTTSTATYNSTATATTSTTSTSTATNNSNAIATASTNTATNNSTATATASTATIPTTTITTNAIASVSTAVEASKNIVVDSSSIIQPHSDTKSSGGGAAGTRGILDDCTWRQCGGRKGWDWYSLDDVNIAKPSFSIAAQSQGQRQDTPLQRSSSVTDGYYCYGGTAYDDRSATSAALELIESLKQRRQESQNNSSGKQLLAAEAEQGVGVAAEAPLNAGTSSGTNDSCLGNTMPTVTAAGDSGATGETAISRSVTGEPTNDSAKRNSVQSSGAEERVIASKLPSTAAFAELRRRYTARAMDRRGAHCAYGSGANNSTAYRYSHSGGAAGGRMQGHSDKVNMWPLSAVGSSAVRAVFGSAYNNSNDVDGEYENVVDVSGSDSGVRPESLSTFRKQSDSLVEDGSNNNRSRGSSYSHLGIGVDNKSVANKNTMVKFEDYLDELGNASADHQANTLVLTDNTTGSTTTGKGASTISSIAGIKSLWGRISDDANNASDEDTTVQQKQKAPVPLCNKVNRRRPAEE